MTICVHPTSASSPYFVGQVCGCGSPRGKICGSISRIPPVHDLARMLSLHAAQLVLPDRIVPDAWIQVDQGRISALGSGTPPWPSSSRDCEHRYLAPGFVDLHVHGGNGVDFLDATVEAFLTASEFHLSGGTTALCPTAATSTYEHFRRVLDSWDLAKTKSASRLLPVHLEGPHLAPAKAGAQDPTLMLVPEQRDREWVTAEARRISQITIAPELPGSLAFIEHATRAGIRLSAGHTEATDADMHAAVASGLMKVTHLYNAMSSATKRGLFRQAGTLEFALAEESLFCELVADGFHVSPTLLQLACRAKGADRIALVTDALAGTGLPEGTRFQLGRLKCKVGPGYCLLEDGSALSGSLARMIDLVRVMTLQAEVPLFESVRMATLTPATILGLEAELGSLATGKVADLVVFDDQFRVHNVWIAGQEAFHIAAP
jgi:N-acetylglucosamine-6-phosphate deacetylase